MINRALPLLAAAWLPAALLAQGRLDAILETKRFHEPGKGELVDVNIAVVGGSAIWEMDARGFQHAQVEAVTTVERNGTIVDFRKAMVHSPDRADTLQGDFTFQERFLLQPGEYVVTTSLRDALSADTTHTFMETPLVVPARDGGVSLSDILFTRAGSEGKDIVPFAGAYFPKETTALRLYAEAYGTLGKLGPGGEFLADIRIEQYEAGKVAGGFRHVQRMRADTVVPLALEFGIGTLPSGNYELAIELRDRRDSLLARRTQFFQRNNPVTYDPTRIAAGDIGPNFTDAYTDADTLAEYLNSMRPIADELERKMIDDRAKDQRPDLMRQLMFTFWHNRNPEDPEGAWKRYKDVVDYVDRTFGCRNMRGYQSDQGYVYLRYGAPNTVVDRSNETTAVPYMIWHYYRAGRYSDRRFVFQQQERSTTCWTLLTSDVPGELSNTRWLDMLVPGLSDAGVKRNEVLDNYNNPR
ncbi:MAG: GWxTD domain-containing protein [Flavobacteriales bacterium]|nr:GWxTD domain-containing protein [Flavobacteriales bacterium]